MAQGNTRNRSSYRDLDRSSRSGQYARRRRRRRRRLNPFPIVVYSLLLLAVIGFVVYGSNNIWYAKPKLALIGEAEQTVEAGTVYEDPGVTATLKDADISDQVCQRLSCAGGRDQSGLMDVMLRSLNLEEKGIHKAYTAIASRMVPGNEDMFQRKGIDFSTSLNVIEPLLNIFSWADLLPHDSEERILPSDEAEENFQEEQPKISFWKRLFHRA